MIELRDHDDDPLDHVKEFLANALNFGITDEVICPAFARKGPCLV